MSEEENQICQLGLFLKFFLLFYRLIIISINKSKWANQVWLDLNPFGGPIGQSSIQAFIFKTQLS